MKKLLLYFTLFFSLFSFFSENITFSSGPNTEAPKVNCICLPGCPDKDIENQGGYNIDDNVTLKWVSALIWEFIKYVAVVAVITLMISGIMYLVSGWEEEKVKKAKTWIIWSLVWVFFSVSAWWIINVLNSLSIL